MIYPLVLDPSFLNQIKFDLRKFHSIVLDQGIVPLFILDDLIDEWINEEKTVN